jgi:hypothetical protein
VIKLTLLSIWLLLAFVLLAGILSFIALKIYEAFKKEPVKKAPPVPNMPLKEMEALVQDKNTPRDDLIKVIKALAAHHAIPAKKDGKAPKEAKRYLDMIFTLASHKSLNEDLVQEMYDLLTETNPAYVREFSRARSR